MKVSSLIICFLLFSSVLQGQIGGKSSFKSLSLPASPIASGLGGTSIGVFDQSIQLALENPAILDSTLDNNITFNNTFYLGGTNFGTLAYVNDFNRAGTLLFALKYIAYGKFDGRDAADNETGNFRAGDYTFSLGLGRSYKMLHYGANFKFIYSHLEAYHALGLALDASGSFYNPEKGLQVTLILKNAGLMIKPFTEGNRESLPLELSLGFSKQFKNLPFKIIVVAHNLQKPDLTYFDPNLVGEENLFGSSQNTEPGIIDKIFRHVIIGGEIDFGKYLVARFGYNHLRRKAMLVDTKKGLVGVSVGMSVNVKQFKIDYSFGKYHISQGVHSLGVSINLNEFSGKSPQTLSSSYF